MKGFPLFPRSLRQLVIMAFVLVLAPLLVLAWQAWQSLNALSMQAAHTNRTTLVDARRSEAMINVALEMERSYRQYCVLDDTTLAKVYQDQRKHYASMLQEQASVLPDQGLYQRLQNNLNALDTLKCASNSPDTAASSMLETFAKTNAQMVQATRQVVYARGQQLQQEIASRGKFFGWQALILFLFSLILVMLFTRMIIGPIKGIEKMINRLGAGQSLDTAITFRGPRELRAISQRILWLSERLAWLESQRHQFLRHISHELKTPLASIREGAALLADQIAGSLTDAQQEIVEILDTSSRNLQKLIEQLLDYNRKLADGALELEQIDLKHLITEVINAHSLPARAKKMRTDLNLTQTTCLAQPTLLKSVLDNLYSNALYYGSQSGNIRITSRKAGKKLYIDVSNSGTPIPPAEKAMIFEPFFQGSQQRKGAVKGSGLGLSLARDSVRRMHGELSLIDNSEADVTFRIELAVFEAEPSLK